MGFYNIMYCFSFIESNLNDLLLFGFNFFFIKVRGMLLIIVKF